MFRGKKDSNQDESIFRSLPFRVFTRSGGPLDEAAVKILERRHDGSRSRQPQGTPHAKKESDLTKFVAP